MPAGSATAKLSFPTHAESDQMPPRLGRQLPHFENVAVSEIRERFSCTRTHRYSLEIPYRPARCRDQLVSVILKNPSSADASHADTTVRRVETYVYRCFERAATLVVLNLFALRATDPPDLVDHISPRRPYNAIGCRNDAVILNYLERSHDIVLAWGGKSGIPETAYHQRIRTVAEMLEPHAHKTSGPTTLK